MNEEKPLTSYTKFSGCGAKLGPGVLERALCGLSQPNYPGLLADFSGYEDAGVYRLSPELALVQTVDFFPPIVDDPRLFGRIAAANALSDIYAMGGQPLTALALVCFPLAELGLDALRGMMAGGLDALAEAGCALLGGHSIQDPEPKLGYAVTGKVHPEKFWRNSHLEEGAAVILTKPIGTGLVNMALRAGIADPAARAAAESSMGTLNKRAAEILGAYPVVACTDVTGFGLLGHAAEMAQNPKTGLEIRASSVPLLPGAKDYAAMGLVPAGAFRNKEGRQAFVDGAESVDPVLLDMLFDPQTSGGLLVALPENLAEKALAELRASGVDAARIGEARGKPGRVVLVP